MKKVYLSGSISGQSELGLPKFRAVALEIQKLGLNPLVPHDIAPWKHDNDMCSSTFPELGTQGEHLAACYLRADLKELLDCDAILMLEDWHYSRGATLEHTVAVACGLRVFYDLNALRFWAAKNVSKCECGANWAWIEKSPNGKRRCVLGHLFRMDLNTGKLFAISDTAPRLS